MVKPAVEWLAQHAHMHAFDTLGTHTDIDLEVIVGVECPNNWFNEKGQASKDSEDIQVTYAVYGGIVSALSRSEWCSVCYSAIPIAWKGQVPKDVMMRRARVYLGCHQRFEIPQTDDVAEAILLAKRLAGDLKSGEDPKKTWTLVFKRHSGGGVILGEMNEAGEGPIVDVLY